jgi:hypothetical protein
MLKRPNGIKSANLEDSEVDSKYDPKTWIELRRSDEKLVKNDPTMLPTR